MKSTSEQRLDLGLDLGLDFVFGFCVVLFVSFVCECFVCVSVVSPFALFVSF